MSNFVHLHTHDEYSLLDGFGTTKSMVARVAELQQTALAQTNHGNLHGTLDFYRECKKQGIKPIIGMEGYITDFGIPMSARGASNREYHHVLLLAANQKGYGNLVTLASLASTEGFYYKPRMDYSVLEQYNKGIITTTGCMQAPICQYLLKDKPTEAHQIVRWFVDVFGNKRFFVELQHHPGIPEIPELNRQLIQIAKDYNLRIILTNDSHYPRPEDAPIHDVLLCVQTNARVNQDKRMRFTDNEYYLKSELEMHKDFLQYADEGTVNRWIENTRRIAEACNVNPEGDTSPKIPDFTIPPGSKHISWLQEITYIGMTNTYGSGWRDIPALYDRVTEELKVIEETKFEKYFLIIHDICQFSSRNNIIWNVRGSGAGSIVFYALGVSFVDPVENELMFSRFLNTFRISIPDCDLDFPDNRREEIIRYIIEKYGDDYVCQVATLGHAKARMAIRDVGRALGLSQEYVDGVARAIKNTPGKPITIENSLDPNSEYHSVDFLALYNNDEQAHSLIDQAAQIENAVRSTGVHAAAVLISDQPLMTYVPVMRPGNKAHTKYVSQWDYPTAESIGMLKVDCLGLATLTIIQKCCEIVNKEFGTSYNYWTIPYDSPESYELLRRGDVIGVFQVENPGLRREIVALQPDKFKHVSDIISLYRPGPIQYIPQYIARSQYLDNPTYKHPLLETILADTQGIAIYQEQVIRILVELGGYSAGEADVVRKAISKKDVKKIEENRPKFIAGCQKRNIATDIASSIYDDIQPFALYSFNLAHATSYARITLITAWLKYHYPLQFLAACLMVEGQTEEKRVKYVEDLKSHGFNVLPPEIGKSQRDFSIEGNGVRFGFSNIRGIGEKLADQLASISNIYEFGDIKVNKRMVEALVCSGALDVYGPRHNLIASLPYLSESIKSINAVMNRGQLYFTTPEINLSENIANVAPADLEKQFLGVWLQFHPLDKYLDDIEKANLHTTQEISDATDDFDVRIVVAVQESREALTKAGKKMAFVKCGDKYGIIDVVIFPKQYAELGEIPVNQVLYIKGTVQYGSGAPTLIANTVKRVKKKA